MDQRDKMLAKLVSDKASTFWEAGEKRLTFLRDMGYSAPDRSIEEDSIFYLSICLGYSRGKDRLVALSLAPASLVLDKDDAIGASIHKPRSGMARPKGGWTHFSLGKYIEETHPEVGPDFCRVPRTSDYASAVDNVLGLYARIMQAELRSVLSGEAWIEGYGVYMA